MPGRKFVSGEEYRFGFNGVEQEDEISEGSYTTTYRSLDTRVGRWRSVDPAAHLYYSWSPYHLSGNNVIRNSDPSGATFTPESEEAVEDYRDYANEKLDVINSRSRRLNRRIAKVQRRIDRNNERDRPNARRTARLNRRIGNLNGQLDFQNTIRTEITASLNEIRIMEEDENMTFHLIENGLDPGRSGSIGYDPINNQVVIHYSNNHSLGHELKHGYQAQQGTLSFGPGADIDGEWAGHLLYDLVDEQEAYRLEYALLGNNGGLELFANYNSITPENISQLQNDVTGVRPYVGLPNINLTINTLGRIVEQVNGVMLTRSRAVWRDKYADEPISKWFNAANKIQNGQYQKSYGNNE